SDVLSAGRTGGRGRSQRRSTRPPARVSGGAVRIHRRRSDPPPNDEHRSRPPFPGTQRAMRRRGRRTWGGANQVIGRARYSKRVLSSFWIDRCKFKVGWVKRTAAVNGCVSRTLLASSRSVGTTIFLVSYFRFTSADHPSGRAPPSKLASKRNSRRSSISNRPDQSAR